MLWGEHDRKSWFQGLEHRLTFEEPPYDFFWALFVRSKRLAKWARRSLKGMRPPAADFVGSFWMAGSDASGDAEAASSGRSGGAVSGLLWDTGSPMDPHFTWRFFPSLIEMDIDILVLIVTIKLFILVPLHLFLRFFEYISVQCQSTCDRNVLRLQRGRQSSGQAGGFWVQNWT